MGTGRLNIRKIQKFIRWKLVKFEIENKICSFIVFLPNFATYFSRLTWISQRKVFPGKSLKTAAARHFTGQSLFLTPCDYSYTSKGHGHHRNPQWKLRLNMITLYTAKYAVVIDNWPNTPLFRHVNLPNQSLAVPTSRVHRCSHVLKYQELNQFLLSHYRLLTLSPPITLRLYTLPPFLILDIWVLWCSSQSAQMSTSNSSNLEQLALKGLKIKNISIILDINIQHVKFQLGAFCSFWVIVAQSP